MICGPNSPHSNLGRHIIKYLKPILRYDYYLNINVHFYQKKKLINNGGGINKIIISEIALTNVRRALARACVFYSHTSFETLPENNIINQNEKKNK